MNCVTASCLALFVSVPPGPAAPELPSSVRPSLGEAIAEQANAALEQIRAEAREELLRVSARLLHSTLTAHAPSRADR